MPCSADKGLSTVSLIIFLNKESMKDPRGKVVDVTHSCHIRWQKVTSNVCSWSLKPTGSLKLEEKQKQGNRNQKSNLKWNLKHLTSWHQKKKSFFLLLLLGKDNQTAEHSKKRSQLLKANCSEDSPGRLSYKLYKYKKFFLSLYPSIDFDISAQNAPDS